MTSNSGRRRMGDVERLAARLDRIRQAARQQAADAVAETAVELRGAAERSLHHAPAGLPHLADRVAVEGEGDRRDVVVRHPAAPYVEYGTRHMPATPFLQPAADAERTPFSRRMADRVRRLFRGGP